MMQQLKRTDNADFVIKVARIMTVNRWYENTMDYLSERVERCSYGPLLLQMLRSICNVC